MNAPVLFEERAAANGMRFGIATLNAPQTLNGLSLEMVDLLAERLPAKARAPAAAGPSARVRVLPWNGPAREGTKPSDAATP